MIDEFIVAALVPRSAHASGTLETADAILAAHPEVATADIYAAAVLGDADGVQRRLAEEPGRATARGGPCGWDALTYLCFSQYLRLRGTNAFVRAAELLLDAGAGSRHGYFDDAHQPEPTFESALYGAAGVAHHGALTRLLLARGADPNLGGEVGYHAPEGFDNEAMLAVVESGRLSASGLTTMLHRKLDWTDLDGVHRLLERGADPNAISAWGDRALHHSLARGNTLPLLEALLDHGADPSCRRRTTMTGARRRSRREPGGPTRWSCSSGAASRSSCAATTRSSRPCRAATAQAPARSRRRSRARRAARGRAAVSRSALAGTGTRRPSSSPSTSVPLSADALPTAVWRERTGGVRLAPRRAARR